MAGFFRHFTRRTAGAKTARKSLFNFFSPRVIGGTSFRTVNARPSALSGSKKSAGAGARSSCASAPLPVNVLT
jgi:hypothetical protein